MKKMRKVAITALTAAFVLLLCVGAWAERPVQSRRQYMRNLANNKNAIPVGWQYEAGYNLWRVSRSMPANINTYLLYKNDRSWHSKMRRNNRPQEILLNTADQTVRELALFLRQNQKFFQFHPAGYDD